MDVSIFIIKNYAKFNFTRYARVFCEHVWRNLPLAYPIASNVE